MEDCDEMFGDEVDRAVNWRRGHGTLVAADRREVAFRASDFGGPLRGRTVRLRFVMQSADLYSFQIRERRAEPPQ